MDVVDKQRRARCFAWIEPLESREMFSVVNVTPRNFIGAIKNSASGDTISFAPDTYTLATNPAGAAANFPSGRHYVGNGATIALSTGVAPNDSQQLINFVGSGSTTEVTGFTFLDAPIDCKTGSFNVHDNSFASSNVGINVGGESNSYFNHNTFNNITGTGIYGYPGSNNTYDNNTFDYVHEGMHLVSSADSIDVSGNVMTHLTRIGIELQTGMTHLTVLNNYMSDWLPQYDSKGVDSHMGISCATGGVGEGPAGNSGPWVGFGEHITISGNVLIQNGPQQANGIGAKSAIEIMGDSDLTIANNYCWGWGNFLLNGAHGSFISNDNTVVGGELYAPDNVKWSIASIGGSGDERYTINSARAPAWPGIPGDVTVAVPAPSKQTKAKRTAAAHVAQKHKPTASRQPVTPAPRHAVKIQHAQPVPTIHSVLKG